MAVHLQRLQVLVNDLDLDFSSPAHLPFQGLWYTMAMEERERVIVTTAIVVRRIKMGHI